LDWIVLKCLEKDPARRYSTARQLADDLDNLLHGEPVLARPITPVQRLWRKCRRNPVLASMTVSLLITLTTVLFLVAILMRHRNPASSQVTGQRVLVLDTTTFAQRVVGPGSGVAVDLKTGNYWAAKLWRTTTHGSGFVVREAGTDIVLAEQTMSLGFDCPGAIAIDSVNRFAWIGAQCGTNNDAVWAVNADNLKIIKEIRCGGVHGMPVVVNPATGRFYHTSDNTSQRIDPINFVPARNDFGVVLGVNASNGFLYATYPLGQNNRLQIIDGKPDPESVLTNITLPFGIGNNLIGVDAVRSRLYVPWFQSNIIAVLDSFNGQVLDNVRLPHVVKLIGNVAVDAEQNRIFVLAWHDQHSPFLYILDGDRQKAVQLPDLVFGPIINPRFNQVYFWVGKEQESE